MNKEEFEYFQRFYEIFDKWAKENPQKAFEFFTGINIERLADVKEISFGERKIENGCPDLYE